MNIRKARVNTGVSSLNLRAFPVIPAASFSSNVLASLPNGTVVDTASEFDQKDAVRTWAYVADMAGKRAGWCASEFLSFDLTDPIPPSPLARPINPIGYHILPWYNRGDEGTPGISTNSLLDFYRRMEVARRPIAFTLLGYAVGAPMALSASMIKSVSPKTIVAARIFTGNNYSTNWDTATRADGDAYYQQFRGSISSVIRQADFIQIMDTNEMGLGDGVNKWWMGAMDAAERDRVKLAVYVWAMGNPPLPGDPDRFADFWLRPDTIELLRRIKTNGHAFCLHQYAPMGQDDPSWRDIWTSQRHKKVYALLPADLQDLPVYILEYGDTQYGLKGPVVFERNLRNSYDEFSTGPIVYAALWTLGDTGGWSKDRLENYMPIHERVALLR